MNFLNLLLKNVTRAIEGSKMNVKREYNDELSFKMFS